MVRTGFLTPASFFLRVMGSESAVAVALDLHQPNQTENTLCVSVPHAEMENLTLCVSLAAAFFPPFFPKNEKGKKASTGSFCLQWTAAFIFTITAQLIALMRTSGK